MPECGNRTAALVGDDVRAEWEKRARRNGLIRVMRASQPTELNERVTTATKTIVGDYLDLATQELGRPLANVLEVGCGIGRLTPELARRAKAITAVDMTPAMLVAAREACRPLTNVDFQCARAEHLPWQGARFDVGVSVWVLMHLLDEDRLAQVCRSLAASCRYLVLIEYERAAVPVSRWSRLRTLTDYLHLLPGSAVVRRQDIDYGGDLSAAALIRFEECG
jgi:2-polyprenyl-3-methyl-5-hydroxy-6-metoxy-1,4-benzoquinol methylase